MSPPSARALSTKGKATSGKSVAPQNSARPGLASKRGSTEKAVGTARAGQQAETPGVTKPKAEPLASISEGAGERGDKSNDAPRGRPATATFKAVTSGQTGVVDFFQDSGEAAAMSAVVESTDSDVTGIRDCGQWLGEVEGITGCLADTMASDL